MNNYKKTALFYTILKNTFFVFLCFLYSDSFAQLTDFENGKSYILGDVEVTGKVNFNPQTIVTFTGLEKGQNIIVPGEEISGAIKKLWKLGYFNDINVYISKISNDSIYLELNINELPKLSDVKFPGYKKGKLETIVKETDLKKVKL